MADFHEVRLPDDVAMGASGGPTFFTTVNISYSGYETRNINWSVARARYVVSYTNRTRAAIEELNAFFLNRMGRAHGFRFKDYADFTAVNQELLLDSTDAQLYYFVKRYIGGDGEYVRRVHKPVPQTDSVWVRRPDDTTYTLAYTPDYVAGTLRLTSALPPDHVLCATFEFDVPVRFDIDHLSIVVEQSGVLSAEDIPLVELRL